MILLPRSQYNSEHPSYPTILSKKAALSSPTKVLPLVGGYSPPLVRDKMTPYILCKGGSQERAKIGSGGVSPALARESCLCKVTPVSIPQPAAPRLTPRLFHWELGTGPPRRDNRAG
jgi:hypothetical protein